MDLSDSTGSIDIEFENLIDTELEKSIISERQKSLDYELENSLENELQDPVNNWLQNLNDEPEFFEGNELSTASEARQDSETAQNPMESRVQGAKEKGFQNSHIRFLDSIQEDPRELTETDSQDSSVNEDSMESRLQQDSVKNTQSELVEKELQDSTEKAPQVLTEIEASMENAVQDPTHNNKNSTKNETQVPTKEDLKGLTESNSQKSVVKNPQDLADLPDGDLQDPEEDHSAEAEIGLACPRCLLPFSDTRVPQTLPECQHVCCTSCLMHLSKWDAISTVECPRCRKTSRVPNGGTAAMETNEWLHRFVQHHHQGKLGEHLNDISRDLQGMREDVEKSVESLVQLEKDTKEALKMEEENVDR